MQIHEEIIMPQTQSIEIGRLMITRLASVTLDPRDVFDSIKRHIAGDWGDLCEADRKSNDRAVRTGDRILSAYQSGEHRFWVITEADRSVTTVLLPEEY